MSEHLSADHTLILGTRGSPLARWQTDYIVAQLQAAWPQVSCQIKLFSTQGDRTQAENKPLPEIGGKGLFTQELEAALHQGEIDLAVHSLKDLPVENPPGLMLGAICGRAEVGDGLVARNGLTLASLPLGAVVGTSSTRRAAQLLALRPDLVIKPIRGNVATRIQKVLAGDYDATVLALAGLERLGLQAAVTERLSLQIMLPAPGQGALAVQCRTEDSRTLALLAVLDEPMVRAAVHAERAFLHALGGGCSAPVAAYAQVIEYTDRVRLIALVATLDGRTVVRVQGEGDAATIGEELAQQALAQGADHILTGTQASALSKTPLQGKRIVITRMAEQSQEFATQLAALGATPIMAPLIRIATLDDWAALDTALCNTLLYDWLILTSANAVKIVDQRIIALGRTWLTGELPRIAAVGPATAAAVRSHGLEPAFVPNEYKAEAIVQGLDDLRNQRVLLPQAAQAGRDLVDLLVARDIQVNAVPIYETFPVDLEPAALAELRQGVDWITLASGSAVQSFCAAIERHHLQGLLERTKIVCIGPVTAAAAEAAGLPVALVATHYTVAGLTEALLAYYS